MGMRFVLPFVLIGLIAPAGARAGQSDGLDHRRLLWYLDDHGLRREVKTPRDWSIRRAQVLRGMQEAMGPLPDRSELPPLDIQVKQSQKADGCTRQTISFRGLFDERITALLYVPETLKPTEKRAAALALHPTGAAGKDIVDGRGAKPNRAYGLELAQRGWIVIAPDYPSFGEQKDYDFAASKYGSGTMKAISDNMRCVDLLLARGDVDRDRIGAIGHSLGGHNALFTAAFDPRIAVCVTSCGWTPFHHYYGGKKLVNWAQPRYMPRIRDACSADPDRVPFDFPEVLAAIAPRAIFSSSPTGDGNFEVEGVRSAAGEIAAIYKLLGAPQRLAIEHPECGHDFPDEIRQRAYRFMEAIPAAGPK